MDDFKKLINREVKKEIEWKVMNDFIKWLTDLMQFYHDLTQLRAIVNKCYQDTPIAQLSQIDNIT